MRCIRLWRIYAARAANSPTAKARMSVSWRFERWRSVQEVIVSRRALAFCMIIFTGIMSFFRGRSVLSPISLGG